MHFSLIGLVATGWLVAAPPPDYLVEVVSPVYEMAGTPTDLARRGETCMSQQLAGPEGGQIIVSSDLSTGVVVASNTLEYRDGLLPWQMRSRITFEGREGRFRIKHTAIERYNDQALGAQVLGASPWAPVGKWWGSGWQKAQKALEDVSAKIAECVLEPSSPADNW